LSIHQIERHRRVGDRQPYADDHRVLSFKQWCELNGISLATGRRIINAGEGPVVTQLSPRRIGITVANNARWLETRARGVA
jgi:predicted DNA-binding transcriptional regulator AlpA